MTENWNNLCTKCSVCGVVVFIQCVQSIGGRTNNVTVRKPSLVQYILKDIGDRTPNPFYYFPVFLYVFSFLWGNSVSTQSILEIRFEELVAR